MQNRDAEPVGDSCALILQCVVYISTQERGQRLYLEGMRLDLGRYA